METLVQQFIKAFGWSILNSLWQSALIYGVLFIILFSLPKLQAKYKHNLAFGSIVLMFGCFGYNFISQIIKSIPVKNAAESISNLDAYLYLNNLPQTFSSKAEQYFPLVITFYLIGIALQLFVIIKGYSKLNRFKNQGLSNIPEEWKLIFATVTANLKINKKVAFHLSEIVNVPLVIGYLKPVVLFPLALVNQLDNDQVEAILIHELSHIRRNDFLLNLIKTAIETFLFYNPFVWMAGKFIHIEREHACDDLVLKATGKPLNYAHALLKLELLKDKTSPAYALAATGKTQNLYQRIKRITNMKTNYLNAKQQMAALTLGVACLFSIAWINPAEKKTNEIKIVSNPLSKLNLTEANRPIIYLDTTKKRKIKIVTIDANGKKTEYNSLRDMPDSLRKDFYQEELFNGNNAYLFKSDSTFKTRDSLFQAKIYKSFNSPAAQLKWKRYGEDVAKAYSSPEAQAKWKKYGEEVAKAYSSPEAQAKWKKFGEEVAKAYSSPEAQAKWKKFGEDIAKEYGSPEAQAKWKKIGEDMAKEYSSPEAIAQLTKVNEILSALPNIENLDGDVNLRINASKNLAGLKSGYSRVRADSVFQARRDLNSVRMFDIERSNNLRQTEEYKKLRQKFDKEVKELQEKMERKQKAERKEKPEKMEN
ncbi:M56 family metallopeptidase [Pedobacter jejuensis]|uniref:Peptidase M56 n=1 Tax=Pedobacter jejuensis TaxID=1268550 RepID=A0A3N0BS98_9SPHI|nr:M56 family metallopeptidase [Pedobacter jejuensis]RNL51703.1 peptidase M56 [Pedobacter jejuensis]